MTGSSHLQVSDGVRIQQRQLLGEALGTTPFRRQERDFLPQRLRSKSAVCPSGERETQRTALEKPAVFARIEVRNSHLAVWLMHPSAEGADESTGPPAPIEENSALLIPWTKPPAKRFKEMVQG